MGCKKKRRDIIFADDRRFAFGLIEKREDKFKKTKKKKKG